ncbi:unnamed protein product [Tenebrio molitor]|nr:unnamed protein product [Tenebrio molitor]
MTNDDARQSRYFRKLNVIQSILDQVRTLLIFHVQLFNSAEMQIRFGSEDTKRNFLEQAALQWKILNLHWESSPELVIFKSRGLLHKI